MSDNDSQDSNDRLILIFLGLVALVSIVAIVVLAVVKADSQPLVAIGSAAVGALATKVINKSSDNRRDSDDYAILGRAATKSIIAEAMRQMGSEEHHD